MSIENTLLQRCNSKCELCASDSRLTVFTVTPHTRATVDHSVILCATCTDLINNPETDNVNHWHCLNDSMWSQTPPVQVVTWRQLNHLSQTESWAGDLLEMMYFEEEMQTWAEFELNQSTESSIDSNGVKLQAGDDVTIIKDLPVKGSSMVIKRGTVVRNINLTNDPTHIQGRANNTTMMIIAQYTKKNS